MPTNHAHFNSVSHYCSLIFYILFLYSDHNKEDLSYAMAMVMVMILMLLLLLLGYTTHTLGQGIVPGFFVFGDSTVDCGNNNNRPTLVKSNFLPYGRDFPNNSPTGRFCNGKLVTDFTVENLGFTTYPPAYLSKEADEGALLTGANFASAASGYLDSTSFLYNAISLTQQLHYYKDYQHRLEKIAQRRSANATDIIMGSIYILSSGSSDYVQNYYINPLLNLVYNPDKFADLLVQSFTNFVQNLYKFGARRIGVTSLPPIGCLPAAITLFNGAWNNKCVDRLNNDAIKFNNKLIAGGEALKKKHPDMKLVVFDIYNPLLELINNPHNNAGFFETRKACCGTGTIETSLLCNELSPGTCNNATGYVFWDSFHPSESANRFLSDELLAQGIDLIS